LSVEVGLDIHRDSARIQMNSVVCVKQGLGSTITGSYIRAAW